MGEVGRGLVMRVKGGYVLLGYAGQVWVLLVKYWLGWMRFVVVG